MTATCIECGQPSDRPRPIDGAYLCSQCLGEVCDGCVPEWISRGDGTPVYWFQCVCGRHVRRGAYKVPVELRGLRHEQWRFVVEGIADAGVMLCAWCAPVAGVELPAQDRELPSNVLAFPGQSRRSLAYRPKQGTTSSADAPISGLHSPS